MMPVREVKSNKAWRLECEALREELAAAQADAALYRWLRDNPTKWSWQPNANVYRGKVVGFCAHDTQYFDFTFEDALNFALAAKEKA